MSRTGLVYHDDYLLHETDTHPECKQRLQVILRVLKEKGYFERLLPLTPQPADIEQVAMVHEPEFIMKIKNLAQRGGGLWDMDTIVCSRSFEVALLAVGGVLGAVDAVMSGIVDNAFALVRPPGHHAEPDQAMGFCLFNNVAIAARYVQKKYGLKKVLIIDWDVHHGNGTQEAFYADPSVLYFSVHQSPLYPGTGNTNETGAGAGLGFTVNVPLPPGAGDMVHEDVLMRILVPIVRQYCPEFIFISAGQDGHYADPLASFRLTTAGYMRMTEIVKELAEETCGGKILVSLEGGYNLRTMPYAVAGIMKVLAGIPGELTDPGPLPKDDFSDGARQAVSQVLTAQQKFWKL